MKYTILHSSSIRIRFHVGKGELSLREADTLACYLESQKNVRRACVYERTGDAVLFVLPGASPKEVLFSVMRGFSFEDEKILALVPEETGRALNRKYEAKLLWLTAGKCFRKLFFPPLLDMIWTVAKSWRFIFRGLRCLLKGKIEVPVLDAAAITASILTGDFATASSVMYLLDVGALLEDWTHKKSVGDLSRRLMLKVDRVWLRPSLDAKDVPDILVDVTEVKKGDTIVVRTSNIIPFDGKVVEGEASINQASMTGESIPVHKTCGGYVYAGTVVEEGECVIQVQKTAGGGKYDQIVRMIEESEKLKSGAETKAYHLADKLVPYSLLGTVITWLFTRNVTRAMAFLMVDFSCALKLAMPLSVLSAIREAGDDEIGVKGGKFLEAFSEAETIVFDKTGTLTHATPTVEEVMTFHGMSEEEALKTAACLEEHYPHSMANAIVTEAKRRGISHDEMHSSVQYVVAHGLSSDIDGKKAIIGSAHFVFEDEGCALSAEEKESLAALPKEHSHLFMAIDGELKAVIGIFDPLREEAAEVIDALHALGLKRVCMMTGDHESTAAAIAARLHLDEYHADVLPEDKAAFIRAEHAAGRKVIMIGDGVNDTPALSEADVGLAVSDGAAIAREIADITIRADDLRQIVVLKRLSDALMRRIHGHYRFIISFNAALIALGVAGVLAPSSSALLHNLSTVATGLHSMTKLLKEEESDRVH